MKKNKAIVCLMVTAFVASSVLPSFAYGPMIPRVQLPSPKKQETKAEMPKPVVTEKKSEVKALNDGKFPGFSEDFKILNKDENKRQGSMIVVVVKDGKIESMRTRYLKGTQLKKDGYPQYLKDFEQMIIEKGVDKVGELKDHEEEGKIVKMLVQDALERSKGYKDEFALTSQKATLKDGTYLGKHHGFYLNEEVLVRVNVKSNAIESIKILNKADDKFVYEEKYFGSGKFEKSFAGKQDANVDVVTGATFTSKAVQKAVDDALLQAQGYTDNHFPGFSADFKHVDVTPIKDGKRDLQRQGTFSMIRIKDGKIDSIGVRNVEGKAIDRKNFTEETKYIEQLQNQIKEKGLVDIELVKGKEKESELVLLSIADALSRSAHFNKEFQSTFDSGKPLKDGTYTGKHHGFYDMEQFEVKVIVKGGMIESVEVVKEADDNFIRVDRDEKRDTAKRFKKMLESFKGKKDAQVDVTSGATFSSKGIQLAVEDALKKAQ